MRPSRLRREAVKPLESKEGGSLLVHVCAACVLCITLLYALSSNQRVYVGAQVSSLGAQHARRELVVPGVPEAPAPVVATDLAAVVRRLEQMPTDLERRCHSRPHSDYGGQLAGKAPQGDAFQKSSAGECCEACFAHGTEPLCNAWVYNTQTKACWLKNVANYPERPFIFSQETSPWSGGSSFDFGPTYVDVPGIHTCVHTVATSNGNEYSNFQTRVLYQTWKRVADEDGPNTMMRKFTRLLHRGVDDDFMTEIPTVRVNPARPECDHGCDFVVADRSQALLEWSRMADAETCSHILVIETDYLFVKPVRRELLPTKGNSIGFHYGYVNPSYEKNVATARRYWPEEKGSLDLVPQTGNAPQLLSVGDFRAIAPLFRNFTVQIEADIEARTAWGWVRDMYAYSFAAAHAGVRHHIALVPFNPMIVQPPADVTLGDATMLHYTWSPIVSLNNSVVWRWDKRAYSGTARNLTKMPEVPPWSAGMRLQANEVVTPGVLDLIRLMSLIFNRAVDDANAGARAAA
jgi:hydroxyproline O-arabinosyltransferase